MPGLHNRLWANFISCMTSQTPMAMAVQLVRNIGNNDFITETATVWLQRTSYHDVTSALLENQTNARYRNA